MISKLLCGICMNAAITDVRACKNRDHIEQREDRDFVSSVSAHVKSHAGLFSKLEALEPPEVAVLVLFIDARVRLRGCLHPAFGNDSEILPNAAVQIELAQLQQVAALQAESAAGLR